MWENLSLDEAIEYARDPYQSIRQWKTAKGAKTVGSTLADVPEEVISAFGFLPVTLLGTHKPLKKAPSLLPDNACSLARSNLELVLSYEKDLFDGFVLPQVCDTTQHMCDIWRMNFSDTYVESILLPRQVDRPSAKYWVKEETKRLISSLEEWSGRSIDDGDLRESIRVHNENKRLLKELYDIKRDNPGTLTNRQMFALLKLSMQVDKKELNETLKGILTGLVVKKEDGYLPVMVTGITCDPPELFDLFDEARLNIVADTLVTGSRYLQGIVDEQKEPVEALTERHFKRGFYSPIHDDVFRNAESLTRLYQESGAKAVIYVHIEFCESEEYDLPDLKAIVKREGIPFHTIVTEYQTLSLSHVRTRLGLFRIAEGDRQPMSEKMRSKDLSKKITKEYMDEAFHAHDLGKLVGYTTAISPVELFVAHDIIPIYPENHAVANLTAKKGVELSMATENMGYSTHLCAYARSDLGFRKTGKSVTGGIPEPDLLMACNSQCFTLTKWFQVLSRRGNGVPIFIFDTPEWIRNESARKEILGYTVLQLREMIAWLEGITKRKFEYDRLKEVLKYSAEASLLYKKFLDMAQYKPSPISIFDALIAMAITVYRRGTPECVEFYRTLCDEIMDEKVAQGIGVLENEKYRLYWENLPVWYKFRDHANLLGSYGAVILTSLYVHAWSLDFDLNKDPLETLAENYLNRFSNSTIEDRADMAMDLFKRYDMNGMIMFMNRSCKAVSFAVPTLKELLTKRTGIPALVFESDMGDPRFYSETQIRTRIEAYFETLDRLRQ